MNYKDTITRNLVEGVTALAFRDVQNGVKIYDAEYNSSKKLEERLQPTVFDIRSNHLNGDAAKFRTIYTAAYWLFQHHDKPVEGTADEHSTH